MSLPIHVKAYAGYRADERPRRFELDGVEYRIYAWEREWRTPDGQYFRVAETPASMNRFSSIESATRCFSCPCTLGSVNTPKSSYPRFAPYGPDAGPCRCHTL